MTQTTQPTQQAGDATQETTPPQTEQTTQQTTSQPTETTQQTQPATTAQPATTTPPPAPNSAFISDGKLRAYTILDNSSMGEWDWQALQLEWDTAQLDDLIKWT